MYRAVAEDLLDDRDGLIEPDGLGDTLGEVDGVRCSTRISDLSRAPWVYGGRANAAWPGCQRARAEEATPASPTGGKSVGGRSRLAAMNRIRCGAVRTGSIAMPFTDSQNRYRMDFVYGNRSPSERVNQHQGFGDVLLPEEIWPESSRHMFQRQNARCVTISPDAGPAEVPSPRRRPRETAARTAAARPSGNHQRRASSM